MASTTDDFARRVLIVAALIALALLAWRLADFIILVLGAVVVGVVLRALAGRLERHLRVPPRWSLLATVLLLVALFALGTWWIGDPLAEQFGKLRERLPAALKAVRDWLHSHRIGLTLLAYLEDIKEGGMPLSRVAGVVSVTFGFLGGAFLVLVMGIYLAAAPQLYRDGLLRLLPREWQPRLAEALSASAQALSRWLLGQSISMLFVGTATFVGLAFLNVPLALAVGVIAGLLGFVPFFGALAGGLLAVLVAFSEGPQAALRVALLCFAIQQTDNHVLMPLVQQWAVQLPPVLALASTVLFAGLFGLMGVLFATPLMVVLMTWVDKLYLAPLPQASRTEPSTRQ
jgi:predicted PurR-regulated permease PerM